MPEPALELRDLSVRYGAVEAVRGLSLVAERGEVVGLIGPNGAGKSSTLHAIMGAVRAAGGEILVNGASVRGRNPEAVARRGIALVPEGRRIFAELTVDENLRVGSLFRGKVAREEFDRIHATNVVTVPLGVDLDQFHPRRHSELVRQQWARREQLLLVHCGRLSVEKHTHRSIDTVGALRDSGIDARLVIVGEGPMRARLERQAARLPVDFTGYIGCRDTVAAILASADVALAPGPHETFGLAMIEALACGTPAVVSRTSALAEILTTDSGATADNDPRAIAHAVSSVISRPEASRRLHARRRAEQFTWTRAAEGMLDAMGAI